MPARAAERRCAAIVAELDIPVPFDLGQFLARLVLQRNKVIYLHPFTSGPGVPCGLWIGTAEANHVFHEEGTTPWHKTHIVLHEIAHLLLDHDDATRAWHAWAESLPSYRFLPCSSITCSPDRSARCRQASIWQGF